MGTFTVFDQFKLKQHNGSPIDLDTDTIKVMIVTNSYTPNVATHATKSDVTNEVSGTGYTARGAAIAGATVSLSAHVVTFAHNDITFSQNAAGFSTGRTYIWYKDTGTDSTSLLIGYMTEAADFGNVAGDLLLDITASGALTFT